MERIWFVVQRYPTKDDPICAFIRPVVTAIADMGVKCTVISAQSLTHAYTNKERIRPFHWVDVTEKGNKIDVYQPKYLSFSNIRVKGRAISDTLKISAVRRAMRHIDEKPDLVYAHFWDMAITAAFATNGKYPIIAVSGEERIDVYDRYNQNDVDKWLEKIKGVICVSTKNYNESKDVGLLRFNPKTVILPNSIDKSKFHPVDKEEARAKLGISNDVTIAAFVGAFIERKGVLRVIEAAKSIPELRLLIIGKGPQNPESDQILFKGLVPHEELINYLGAADFFVLPTLAEGCCNAIVEAMACGLPIISSDLPFNDDILDESNSIRIAPTNIADITNAMRTMMNDAYRIKLGNGALDTAAGLSIEERVNKIYRFIQNTLYCEIS